MRTKLAIVAVAGGIGLTGGLLLGPGVATAADSGSSGVSSRLTALKDALKGLVDDKTITQSQADAVAKTLDQQLPQHGPGRFGPRGGGAHLHPEAVAKALGLTLDELRTQAQAGRTLTQIAQSKGISKATLVDRLVAAAKADIAGDVEAGRLTQAQADAIHEDLAARIGEKVDRVPRAGRGGPGHDGGPRPEDAAPGSPGAQPSSSRTA